MAEKRSQTIDNLIEKWLKGGFSGTASAGRVTTNQTWFYSSGIGIAKRFPFHNSVGVIQRDLISPMDKHKSRIIRKAKENNIKVVKI